jgi:hypothetical protein
MKVIEVSAMIKFGILVDVCAIFTRSCLLRDRSIQYLLC